MKEDLIVPGLDATISFQAAAKRILKAKAKPMFAWEKATRAGKNTEALHQMRVASRRLRETMEIFRPCYAEEAFEKQYKRVQRVTRTLGKVRNFDVCIDFFSKFRNGLKEPEADAAVSWILKQQKRARKRARRKMLRKLNALNLKRLRRSLRRVVARPAGNGEETDLVGRARTIVEGRLDDLFGYRSAIEDESDVDALHQMRIAAKKLRYAMETLYVIFEDEAFDELHSTVKGMQDILGEIHDLDVFIEMIDAQREDLGDRKRTRDLVPGMTRVEEMLRERRHVVYVRFMAEIREQGEPFRDRVHGALAG